MSADNFLIFRETKERRWRVYETQLSGAREYSSFKSDDEADDYLKDNTFEKCLTFASVGDAEIFIEESGIFTEYGDEIWHRAK